MKILHTTADWKWTGPAEPMLNAVQALRARGHDVDFACPEPPEGHSDGLAVRARKRDLEPAFALPYARGFVPWRDRHQVVELRRTIADRGYQVVHAHHTRDHILAALALRGATTRLCASWHHGEPIAATPWNRALYGPRRTRALAVLTPRVARAARADLGGRPERVGVVPGSVDADLYLPRVPSAERAAALGIEPGQRVVGLVARLQPHRRVEVLLDALERALPAAPDLRLVVVGRGTRARQVLDDPVRERGLGAAVLRAGYLREDYADVLALFHALVFLVPGSDGSCRAVLEAMSMAIPVIATRRGALPDIVQDGETGRLVDERPEALAEALLDVARDPPTWVQRGKAARDRVLARHTPAVAAERLEALYDWALGPSS